MTVPFLQLSTDNWSLINKYISNIQSHNPNFKPILQAYQRIKVK